MKKFEYKTIEVNEQIDEANLIKCLNEHGQEGWEPVHFYRTGNFQMVNNIILQREI